MNDRLLIGIKSISNRKIEFDVMYSITSAGSEESVNSNRKYNWIWFTRAQTPIGAVAVRIPPISPKDAPIVVIPSETSISW